MKTRILYTYLTVILLLFAGVDSVYGKITWEAKTIKKNTNVVLNEDLHLNGTCTINAGYTLTIAIDENATGPITITSERNMFNVKGTLIIKGKSDKRIILDGGADYFLDTEKMTLTPNSEKKMNYAINNTGKTELRYVTIQNCRNYGMSDIVDDKKNSDYNGAALNINATGANKGTYLYHCTIQKCHALLGSAMMIQGSSPVVIEDSEITGCFTGGETQDNSGGAIRTYGSTGSSLYLTRVKFTYNYALRNSNYANSIKTDGNGGALFWNAKNASDTKCVINGCEFAYNKSDDNGGAIKAQSALFFEGEPTVFHHNTAPVGAAIYIEGYTGGAGVSKVDNIVYDLNSSLEIYENISPNYTYKSTVFPGQGAGIHFFFGPDMQLQSGTKITVNLNGAKIYKNITGNENTTLGEGGGIYFEKSAEPNKHGYSYTYEINMDFGQVYQNTSYGQGGGVYVSEGDINSSNINNQALVITGNNSAEGGGIYINNGNLNLANGSILNNISNEGGGIYINNGNFTINAGNIQGNKANSGKGGGVYIVGQGGKGIFTMAGGIISANESSANGGGTYINGGKFILNQGTGSITGNFSNNSGGGVCIENGGTFEMNGGSISGNGNYESSTKTIHGGGVYLNGGKFQLSNGSIADNAATGNGGGVCIVNGGTFEMKGGSITGNGVLENTTKTTHGGGVYLNGGNFELTSGTISGNAATGNGGGVFLTGENCIYKLLNGNIQQNSAAYGGGVYLEKGKFILGSADNPQNGNIYNNTATQGGGVYIGSPQTKADDSGNSSEGFVMYGGNIISNYTKGDGGGIYLMGGDFNQYGGIIQTNTSETNGGGIFLDGGSFNLENGVVQENVAATGGGIFLEGGSFNLVNGTVQKNFATTGGGIYLSGGNFKMADGSIALNGMLGDKKSESGGGIYLSGGSFTQKGGEISQNISTVKGGGICIIGGGNFTMENGSITSNGKNSNGEIITMNGGGVYLESENEGGNFTLGTSSNSNNGTNCSINGNGAQYGGGVYLKGGSFVQHNGSLDGNIAEYFGGGVCILGGTFTINNGLIQNNGKTDNNNTPVTDYGGGVYMNNGNLSVVQGKILNNASAEYGGGIYILDGTVDMGDGFIENNKCSRYGGGVYVFNNADDGEHLPVNFSGGIIQLNEALYGGGICVDGRLELNIDGAQIMNNTAVNGGGVCLMNNAIMKFGNGWITGNKAVPSDANSNTYIGITAYQQPIENVEGIGGGIYLDSYAQLVFNPDNSADYALGLFQNVAYNGADELFANGQNTSVTIPNVSLMANLEGFTGAGSLTWVEDYITNDPKYDKGTFILEDKWNHDAPENFRYRKLLEMNETSLPQFPGGQTYTNYVCFALGFETIYITVVKNGLAAGESAIFSLSKEGTNNVKPIRIILTGTGASIPVSQRIGVTAGEWNVTETPWSWTYTPISQTLKQDITDPEKRTFVFNNTKDIQNGGTIDSKSILYDEKSVVKDVK